MSTLATYWAEVIKNLLIDYGKGMVRRTGHPGWQLTAFRTDETMVYFKLLNGRRYQVEIRELSQEKGVEGHESESDECCGSGTKGREGPTGEVRTRGVRRDGTTVASSGEGAQGRSRTSGRRERPDGHRPGVRRKTGG